MCILYGRYSEPESRPLAVDVTLQLPSFSPIPVCNLPALHKKNKVFSSVSTHEVMCHGTTCCFHSTHSLLPINSPNLLPFLRCCKVGTLLFFDTICSACTTTCNGQLPHCTIFNFYPIFMLTYLSQSSYQ